MTYFHQGEFKKRADSIEIINALNDEVNEFGEFMGRKQIESNFCINPGDLNENLIGPVSKTYDWQPIRGNFKLSLKDVLNKTVDTVFFTVR